MRRSDTTRSTVRPPPLDNYYWAMIRDSISEDDEESGDDTTTEESSSSSGSESGSETNDHERESGLESVEEDDETDDTLSTRSGASSPSSVFSLSSESDDVSETNDDEDDTETDAEPETVPRQALNGVEHYDAYDQVPRIFWSRAPPPRPAFAPRPPSQPTSNPWSALHGATVRPPRMQWRERPPAPPPASSRPMHAGQQRRIDPLRYGSMFPGLCSNRSTARSSASTNSWFPLVFSASRGYDHDDWRTLGSYYRDLPTPSVMERNVVCLSDAQLCRTYSRAQLKSMMLRFHPDKATADRPLSKRVHKILFQKVFRVYKQLV